MIKLAVALSVLSNLATGDVDWREKGWVSAPSNQEGCGGCYGFSSVSLLESFTYGITGKKIPFSPQFYVDCFDGNGCAGGSLKQTLQYVEESQYQAYLEDYGFTGYYDPEVCINGGFKNRTARNALADVWLLKYQRVAATEKDLVAALARGPTAHDMYVSSDVFDWDDKGDTVPVTDNKCYQDPNPHSWSFVGYKEGRTSDGQLHNAYVIKGSYGGKWAGNGFALYDGASNKACGFTGKVYTVYMAKRREIEYRIGHGKLNFEDAQQACENLENETGGKTGWTLAIIPTRMHVYQVYEMFTGKYGDDVKAHSDFNYFWIGINQATSPEETMKWIDNETSVKFSWFGSTPSKKFVKMAKFNKGASSDMRGKWYSEAKTMELRFMCSRFRYEVCPRISQTSVEHSQKVTFTNSIGEETLEIESGTKASFTCMPGFVIAGSAISECKKDNTWSTFPKCVNEKDIVTVCPQLKIRKSKRLKIKHGAKTITNSDEIPDGAIATLISCKPGFQKKVSGKTTCTNGKWVKKPRCVKKSKKQIAV